MKRRSFIRNGVSATGLVALNAFPHHLFADTIKKYATRSCFARPEEDFCQPSGHGDRYKRASAEARIKPESLCSGLSGPLPERLRQGRYVLRSADQYGTHPHVREALKTIPRDKVVLLTKTHATTEAEMKADLDRFRRELNTDYIDILLLHMMVDSDWPEKKKGAMAVISEAQQKGIVRTHGTSCHTLEALKTAAATPWVEVDLARFNAAQVAMDADPNTVRTVLREKMKAKGKGVIGMRILGAGRLR